MNANAMLEEVRVHVAGKGHEGSQIRCQRRILD